MYFNIYSQIVNNANAAVSFTTDIVWQNFDGGMIGVSWTSLTSSNGYVKILGSGDNGANYCELPDLAQTMTAASGCQFFNIVYFGGTHLRIQYAAVSNTTGTIQAHITRKCRR